MADVERRLVAIFAADVEGYSRLMGSDEVGTLRNLTVRRKILDALISAHRGRIANTAGDSVLAEFASAVDAVQCAVEAQTAWVDANDQLPPDRRINFRIGVHVGDVMVRAGDLFGDGVNIAARLQSSATADGICISSAAHEQVKKLLPLTFVDLGMQYLKNIEPIRAYAVSVAAEPSQAARLADAQKPLALPDKPSIAVLPFQNMSGDPEQEYFADGMVEEIITALSRFHWLFVIARTSTFAYKSRTVDVKQVSRELGVRYVLEGSVRKAGNRVRITGQLIDATTGAHLWADRFEGSLENVFELQDQVASGVVGAIDPKLREAEMARSKRKPPANLDAYDCFLRAYALLYQWTNESNEEALRLLYKAIELDPDYAQAYALAAWCYWNRKLNGLTTELDNERREATKLAREAVRLGKDDAFSLCWAGFSLAMVVGELKEGAALIDRALVYNPNHAVSWSLSGWVRIRLNQPEIAIEHFTRALRLSPLDLGFPSEAGIAFAHIRAHRYDEALPWAEKALRDQPNSADAAMALAISSVLVGDLEKAEGAMKRVLEIAPGRRVSTVVGPGRHGRFADALRKAGMPE
jgi:TolB-like protein/class 3 adenylate cyclase/Tfp pilus assembly protein PilF